MLRSDLRDFISKPVLDADGTSGSLLLEKFYEKHILPQFPLPKGYVLWQGHSTLSTDSSLHYFSLDTCNYMLVFEDTSAVTDKMLHDTVLPSQKLVRINPLNDEYSDVYFRPSDECDKYIPDVTGYFTLFLVIDASKPEIAD